VYLINYTPTPLLSGQSPYEFLFSHKPNYSHLRVFGCLCYASVLPRSKDKFSERATSCLFIGYPYGHKGYKVYDLHTHKSFISRDVVFSEHIFPYNHQHLPSHSLPSQSMIVPIPLPVPDHDSIEPIPNTTTEHIEPPSLHTDHIIPTDLDIPALPTNTPATSTTIRPPIPPTTRPLTYYKIAISLS
jgi:hypothetical protein